MSNNLQKIIDVFENASPRDKILQYLTSSRKGDLYLTDQEMRYMEMLDYADDIIRSHRTKRDKEHANMIVEKYGVSLFVARNIVLDAKYVHGSTSKPIKSYERQIVIGETWALYKVAKDKNDLKNALAALDLISRVLGLDQHDDEQANEEPKTIIMRPVFAPETLGVPNPENVDELVAEIRKQTNALKKANEEIQ